MLGGGGSIPSGVMMVDVLLHILSYHDNPLIRLVIWGFALYMFFFLSVPVYGLLCSFYFNLCKIGRAGCFPRACECIII
jgi:hypothetical protein